MFSKVEGLAGEFRKFINRGNVIDVAVGIIIGAAFSKIINSLVADVVMPALGMLVGEIDLTKLQMVLRRAYTAPDGSEHASVVIRYGMFMQAALDFLIIAFSLFIAIKIASGIQRKRAAAAPPPPDKKEILLAEIRDLLKERK
ncbi:MAG: large-conductance mechanosensitive channel protein MscL [Victivallaceae bacterium]|nr:large-conductance mechanosensitive channel protein MscL [Victivallaceae bacterium]